MVRRMNSRARYLASGHLLFREGGALVVQPFDASSGTVSGDPVQLAPDVWADRSSAAIASAGGMLAYRGGAFGALAQLTWFDRQGTGRWHRRPGR